MTHSETAAIGYVLADYRTAMAERITLMNAPVTGPERIEQLAEANRIDARHAVVAEALIDALNADPGRPDLRHVLIGGVPRLGKTASPRLLAALTALHGAEFDLAAAYACPDCGHLPGCGCDCCPYPMPAVAELQNGGA